MRGNFSSMSRKNRKKKGVLGVLHPGPNNPSGCSVTLIRPSKEVSEITTTYGRPERFAPIYVEALRRARPFRVLDDGTKIGFEVLPETDAEASKKAEEPKPKAESKAKTKKGGK